ncbi:MAG: helix-turn-helix transcriptional regulator [Stenomitos rutilans HA7619-LM2]|jgi:transcriptional regulator with XRE-family HTH domain|nr:helix-turn-helix transcriptional regulator [Stenomitos rutilans HA7619-LM2]
MIETTSEPQKGRPGLKALREAIELTQAELAHAVNSTEKTVRNWENANAIPSFDKAVLLAKVLGVSLKQLAIEFGCDVKGLEDEGGS